MGATLSCIIALSARLYRRRSASMPMDCFGIVGAALSSMIIGVRTAARQINRRADLLRRSLSAPEQAERSQRYRHDARTNHRDREPAFLHRCTLAEV